MPHDKSIHGPHQSSRSWFWQAASGSIQIRFVGRGPGADCQTALRAVSSSPARVAWLRQTHSRHVVEARSGISGEGDALFTERRDLALAIASADCVPILLAADRRIAAIHAGWRGLVGDIIGATLRRLATDSSPVTAWIGPAIGACCYEVSGRLAERIALASRAEVVVPGARGRPHVDLPGAAATQLRAGGVDDIQLLIRCTRCDTDRLWSYRRERAEAGRNHAFIWRQTP